MERPRLTTIGFATRDRPAELARAIESFAANCRDRPVHFVAVDDSADRRLADETRSTLAGLVRNRDLTISYAGAEAKRLFIEILIEEYGVPRLPLEFALLNPLNCPNSTGGNRNALTLHAAGEAFVSADDDVIARVVQSPGAAATPGAPSPIPGETWFLAGREDLDSLSFTDDNILHLHEGVLGARIKRSGPGAATGWSVVRATMMGLAGDCAMGTPIYYLAATGASRERLHRSEESYRAAFECRQVVHVPAATELRNGRTLWLGPCVAYDNRDLLPPFCPVQRDSDGIFATVLAGCFTDTLVGYLPRAILHLPPEPRVFRAADLQQAALRISFPVLLRALLNAWIDASGPSSDPSPLEALATHLSALGRARRPAFAAAAHNALTTMRLRIHAHLESLLVQHRRHPEAWARAVDEYLAASRGALDRETFIEPSDLSPDDGDRVGMAQRIIFNFGELLQAWPTLWAAARSARLHGARMAQPIRPA